MNEPSPPRLDDQLCFAIYSANMAINRAYLPALEGLGITYPQYLVLSALAEHSDQTVGSVAGHLCLESSTVTPLVKRLEVAGLVSRARNPADERQVLLTLRPEGAAVHRRSRILTETLTGRLDMPPAQTSDLVAVLRDLCRRVSRSAAPTGESCVTNV